MYVCVVADNVNVTVPLTIILNCSCCRPGEVFFISLIQSKNVQLMAWDSTFCLFTFLEWFLYFFFKKILRGRFQTNARQHLSKKKC